MSKIIKKLKTKSDVISELTVQKELPLSTMTLVVDTIFEEISQALLKGQKVELRGFGTFGVKKHGAYIGRNPRNQEKIMIKSKKRPWFKLGVFREALNKK